MKLRVFYFGLAWIFGASKDLHSDYGPTLGFSAVSTFKALQLCLGWCTLPLRGGYIKLSVYSIESCV